MNKPIHSKLTLCVVMLVSVAFIALLYVSVYSSLGTTEVSSSLLSIIKSRPSLKPLASKVVFNTITSIHLAPASDVVFDTIPAQLRNIQPADDTHGINLKIAVYGPSDKPLSESAALSVGVFEVTANFDTLSSFYNDHDPPGYTIRMVIYSPHKHVRLRECIALVESRVRAVLPIVYERRAFRVEPKKKVEEPLDPPQYVFMQKPCLVTRL